MLVCQFFECHASGGVCLPNSAGALPCELGEAAFLSGDVRRRLHRDTEHMIGVSGILGSGDQFEVFEAVVVPLSAPVIDVKVSGDRPEKSVGNQSMCEAGMLPILHGKAKVQVSLASAGLDDLAGPGAGAGAGSAEASHTADFVVFGEFSDRQPDFIH